MKATIVLVGNNSLMMLGLKSILEKIIPFADIVIYNNVSEMHNNVSDPVFHYFITPASFAEDSVFFRENRTQTIILSDNWTDGIPSEFKRLNTNLSPKEILQQLLQFQQHAHHGYVRYPQELANKLRQQDLQEESALSGREIEVLTLLAKGMINKEIADKLNISVNTVITHRKNIMQKLQSQSLSKLVVYAVQHNYITTDEIK